MATTYKLVLLVGFASSDTGSLKTQCLIKAAIAIKFSKPGTNT